MYMIFHLISRTSLEIPGEIPWASHLFQASNNYGPNFSFRFRRWATNSGRTKEPLQADCKIGKWSQNRIYTAAAGWAREKKYLQSANSKL